MSTWWKWAACVLLVVSFGHAQYRAWFWQDMARKFATLAENSLGIIARLDEQGRFCRKQVEAYRAKEGK